MRASLLWTWYSVQRLETAGRKMGKYLLFNYLQLYKIYCGTKSRGKRQTKTGRRRLMNTESNEMNIPIPQKLALTISEAAAYSNIGVNKISSMLRVPNCPFVLYVGTKRLVKREEFEKYIHENNII